jgi:1,2-diacylglycerol 3-beta-galactosyltransferase
MDSQNKKPHILFLFSDTGGGHRSATEALIEALKLEYRDAFSHEMVDIFKDYAPRPLNRMPDWYPYMVKAPQLWGASFYATNGRPQARAITATIWPVAARTARAIIRNHPSDLVVTVHPIATSFILKALGKLKRPPFITVVTDMVTTHALWFDARSDLIFVPTQSARQKAIHYGMSPEKVVVVGQPVAQKYCVPAGRKDVLREKLGWPKDKTIVLLVGGGEGMGPLAKTARAIAESGLDLALVVVAGRNERLKASLEKNHWPVPTFIYGFTKEMPDFMRASDVLVTKAGPGTIAEALNAHLPIILYARLPGQEDGNVTYVCESGAGVWASTPKRVVATLRSWVEHPEQRKKVVEACRRAARPAAAITIARQIGQKLGLAQAPAELAKHQPPTAAEDLLLI